MSLHLVHHRRAPLPFPVRASEVESQKLPLGTRVAVTLRVRWWRLKAWFDGFVAFIVALAFLELVVVWHYLDRYFGWLR
jgi:hypothetical protein